MWIKRISMFKKQAKTRCLVYMEANVIRKEFAHGDNTDKNKILMVKLFIV